MHKTALVLACLACVGHAAVSQKPEESLATLLQTLTPTDAFNPSSSATGAQKSDPTVAKSNPVMVSIPGGLSDLPSRGAESMEGVGPETAMKMFDPLSLSKIGSEKTLRFFRHAEIKHGRVAMAAIVGLLFHINHIHFPGYLSPTFKVSFEQLSNMGPFEAWNAIPLLGQLQIIWTIAGLEHASECLNPAGHYTAGGTPGDLKFLKRFWDTPGFTKNLTPEELAEKREAELKNGRLAMLGIASICASMAVPGSVPLLTGAKALTGPAFALPFGTF